MKTSSIHLIRNMGIISHIDAGKTTVSERVLYYTGETHKIGEVHEGQAVMDWMVQEQERGITITATATTCRWNGYWINLIDTPGHIDFTIEVERSMRVLDGAIAVFSAVEGVQPQSESVWRQAARYGVPRICFINKMDRIGADYRKVLREMETKLHGKPVLMQLPIGQESGFSGMIDLLGQQALFFSDHDQGRTVLTGPVSLDRLEEWSQARQSLLEAAADFDDTVLSDYLEGKEIPVERVKGALARGTRQCRIFPVFLGAALRNKGVQPLLDGVTEFLPSPLEALLPRDCSVPDGREIACDPEAPFSALAFKVLAEDGKKLTYLRIYSGTVQAGLQVLNSSRGSTERISQLFRMHAHKRERIPSASAGEIVAALGLRDALTGDTVCDPGAPVLLQSMNVPEPVVSLAVEPRGAEDREKLLPALEKLQWEDPTFRVREDQETGQTILTGMGELHLEIIIDRLRRDFGVGVKTGVPKVVYRETVQSRVERREKFHRELDGKVQEGELLLRVAPAPRGSGISILVPEPEETTLPAEMLQAVKETLCLACSAGCRTGYPLTDVVVEVVEAPFLPGQTTETGLRAAAFRCMSESAASALLLLEPVMALEITTPQEFAGKVLGSLQQKRSRVEGIETDDDRQLIRAQVPLVEMFGYMTELRSATKGHGTFTMEFSRFEAAPAGALAQFGL